MFPKTVIFVVTANGFCSSDYFTDPVDKLGYVLQVYAAKNHISLNNCDGSERFVEALRKLYETEEFKELESRIIDYLNIPCKGVRFDEDIGWGYIDDSHDAVEEFCTYQTYDPIEFIFGNYVLSYHYDG